MNSKTSIANFMGKVMSSRDSIIIGILLLFAPLHSSSAAIVSFILDGNAGLGLLPGNENPVATGGTGGLGSGGISYDTVSNVLSIDIVWGSANGFVDLADDVSASHIHGFTASPPAGFSQNADVLYTLHTLPGFDTTATSGGFTGTVGIQEIHEAGLLAGQTYINVHTPQNGGGEIRGQLVVNPVPVPAASWLFGSGLLCLFGLVRRKHTVYSLFKE